MWPPGSSRGGQEGAGILIPPVLEGNGLALPVGIGGVPQGRGLQGLTQAAGGMEGHVAGDADPIPQITQPGGAARWRRGNRAGQAWIGGDQESGEG